jgi:hypothetical protein
MQNVQIDWRARVIIASTIVGALTGLAAGMLLKRTAEESGEAPKITTGDGIKVVLAIIGVVRGVAALGGRK